jgi:hypothetical protein
MRELDFLRRSSTFVDRTSHVLPVNAHPNRLQLAEMLWHHDLT